ncbi:OBERON-like protein [Camellia lanceoleosa]|uniref:OBERON-like protein n=1 Tax=Camellia lanceoleosa TaxID=1840588 RepID=A0ACC0IZL9_9ERIC|nr:OBERON-like protein [Camellia lanceoleosa]
MGTSSGSHFHQQPSPKMLPPRQQPRELQTSLSLVSLDACGSPNLQERGSNSDQVRESPSENKISLRDVAREKVDIISERIQHLPNEFLEKLKTEIRVILEGTGGSLHREEFLSLQKLVQSRSDLTDKTLIRAHKVQLETLVAIKTGIQAFLHPSVSLSQASLIEVFLYKRCRNIACGSPLPTEDCNCEACSIRNGFCNLCMCVICNKFDFEVNTCRWIGCDLCSHWTHTDCAIRNGLIGPGPGVKTGSVPADMLTSPPMNLG